MNPEENRKFEKRKKEEREGDIITITYSHLLVKIVWEEIPAAQHPNLVVKERETVIMIVSVLAIWCVD